MKHNRVLVLLSTLALCAGASAQKLSLQQSKVMPAGPDLPFRSTSGSTDPTAIQLPEHPVYDVDASGGIWAISFWRYKAGFAADGATYVPFFGSDAPHNFPVRFRLAAATVGGDAAEVESEVLATRSGDLVSFDRGFATERYAMQRNGMEQSFLIETLPAGRGEVVLSIDVATELAAKESGRELRFEGEHGVVTYGAAVAFDARGRKTAVERRWRDGTIELVVPSRFVATAELPLVVDPFVGALLTFGGLPSELRNPDVATNDAGRAILVTEIVFSATDSDVASFLFDGAGLVSNSVAIDVTTDSWTGPFVATSRVADRAVIVASRTAGGISSVWARTQTMTVDPVSSLPTLFAQDEVSGSIPPEPPVVALEWAATDSQSPSFYLGSTSSGGGGFQMNLLPDADVPGDALFLFATPFPGPDLMVSPPNGSVPGLIAVPSSVPTEIALLSGGGDETTQLFVEPTDVAISAARVRPDEGDVEHLLVWSGPSDRTVGDTDIYAKIVRLSGPFFGAPAAWSFGPIVNVTRLETEDPSVLHHDFAQSDPEVIFDGHGYTIVYTEDYQNLGSDFDVYATSLAPRGDLQLRIAESRFPFGMSPDVERQGRVASFHDGGTQNAPGSAAAWVDDNGLAVDEVFVQVYAPTQFSVLQTIDGAPGEFLVDALGIGDRSGDGVPDVAAVFDTGGLHEVGRIYSGADGALLEQIDLPVDGMELRGSGDTDGDGLADVMVQEDLVMRVWCSVDSALDVQQGAARARILGDVDGDGLDEPGTLIASFSTVFGFFNFQGFRFVSSPSALSLTSDPDMKLAHGDLNGDGFGDVVIARTTPPGISVYAGPDPVGDGSGVELYGAISLPAPPAAICADGDLNGDGCDDILVSEGSFSTSLRAFSGCDGSLLFFLPDTTVAPVELGHLGDVNGDGYGDFFLADPTDDRDGASPNAGLAEIRSGFDGSHLFSFEGAAADLFLSATPIGDVDGDGFADVLLPLPRAADRSSLAPGAFSSLFVVDVGYFGNVATARHEGTACVGSNGQLPRIASPATSP